MDEKSLALFDFDKTITDRDTFFDFLSFACGKFKVICVTIVLMPLFPFHFAGFLDGGKFKEIFFKMLIAGWTVEKLEKKAKEYSLVSLKKIVRKSALEEIKKHKDMGADVAIVSASPSIWIQFFAKEQGVNLLATELEVIDGRITGNISGKNCRGPQKVVRIENSYDLSKYKNIFAYGDSSGDKEMLDLANHKYYQALS